MGQPAENAAPAKEQYVVGHLGFEYDDETHTATHGIETAERIVDSKEAAEALCLTLTLRDLRGDAPWAYGREILEERLEERTYDDDEDDVPTLEDLLALDDAGLAEQLKEMGFRLYDYLKVG